MTTDPFARCQSAQQARPTLRYRLTIPLHPLRYSHHPVHQTNETPSPQRTSSFKTPCQHLLHHPTPLQLPQLPHQPLTLDPRPLPPPIVINPPPPALLSIPSFSSHHRQRYLPTICADQIIWEWTLHQVQARLRIPMETPIRLGSYVIPFDRAGLATLRNKQFPVSSPSPTSHPWMSQAPKDRFLHLEKTFLSWCLARNDLNY